MSFHCLLSNQTEDCFGCSLLRQQLFELTLKVVKNPNWQEADQLDITYTNCSQGTTKKLKTNLVCNKANPRITRLQDQHPNHSSSSTSQCVLLFGFSNNYPNIFFLVTVCKLVMFCQMSTLLYQYINHQHYQAFQIYKHRGVCSFKLTKHLLGVESSFAPTYPKIPVRRTCKRKDKNLTILIN